MKIAITGGTGFIGSYLLDHIPAKINAVVLSRSEERSINAKGRSFSLISTDFELESLLMKLDGIDAVVHLASERPKPKTVEKTRNLDLDYNVFKACHEIGITNVVFTSSRSVYGSQPVPWTEETLPRPNSLYAVNKLQSEMYAEFFNRKGMKIKSLRVAQVLGVGEYEENLISQFLKKANNKETIEITVAGEIIREYIYAKDLVRALMAALNNPDKEGVFNVGSGMLFSIESIASHINMAFGNDDNITFSERPKTIYEKSILDSTKFRKEFDWQPRWSVEEMFQDLRNDYLSKQTD